MPSPIVLFDCDCTLIDTTALTHLLDDRLAEVCSTTVETVQAIRKTYRESIASGIEFDPDQFIAQCASATNTEIEAVSQAFFSQSVYEATVFPEVPKALQKVAQHARIGVYTEGKPEWQAKKLELGNLMGWFEPSLRWIVPKKTTLEVLASLPSGSFVIDDKPRILAALVDHAPQVQPVHIDRSQTRSSQQPSGVPVIHSLDEVSELLTKI